MAGHPSEYLLSTYSLDPSLAEDAEGLERHLAGCESCREILAQIRSFDALLALDEAWADADHPTPSNAPLAMSRAAARNRREDADAERMLGTMLEAFLAESSGAFVWADIASRPEFHTSGVVRKLASAADKAQYSVPRRALILAETASAIVGMLSLATYTSVEIAALRGLAWKQRANAHRQLGGFKDALDALHRAERAYRELPRPELDLASITFIRATVHFYEQSYALAEQEAQESVAAFERLGQTEYYLRARHLQGCIAFEQRQVGQAQIIFDSIYAHGEAAGDLTWVARESLTLGHCNLERGDIPRAAQAFHKGMVAFQQLGMRVEALHCQWGLALVVQREGRYRLAVPRLQAVREELLALGIVSAAALVNLDIMETFLLLGDTREVRRVAGNVVRLLKEVGMVTGAVTAADYLRQAAVTKNVTPSLIDHIRRYFRRVDVQPDLAFVPPASL